MKKLVIALLALLPIAAFSAASARAEGNFPFPTGERHDWGIGTEIYYYHYEEPDFMQNEGAMYGLDAHYKYRDPNRWSVMAEIRGAWGTVDYSSNGTGSADNNSDGMAELRLTGGYDFILNSNWTMTPFFGIGYRYLKDDSQGTVTTTGARGYERISQYLYSPIGLDFEYDTKQRWTIGAILEFDIFYHGWQESRLGGAVAGLSDVDNEQDGGYGLRGSVPFRLKGDRYDILIEPFIRWWKIEDSDEAPITFSGVLVGYGLEPENETLEGGCKVLVIF